MKQRPWILIVLAVGHFLAPFINLIFDAVWAGVPILNYIARFFQSQNFSRHWFHFFAPILAGVAIYLCQKWSYFVYVSLMTILAYLSYNSYLSRTDLHGPWILILVYLVNIVIVTYFFLPAVRQVYFDPRLRWWETMPRYYVDLDCQYSLATPATSANSAEISTPVSAALHKGVISNFSQTGLFLKASGPLEDRSTIEVTLPYENQNFQFHGQVIHHGRQNSHGFGVQFLHTQEARKAAKSLAERLHAKGLLQTDRSAMQEDTFMWWVRQLLSTGKGFLPRAKK